MALAAALPGRFIYLFCTNRVAADSFSPGLKREKRREGHIEKERDTESERQKEREEMLSGSFLSLGLGGAAAVTVEAAAAAATAVPPAG